ncbi:alpha/beta hydrolase fold domain-containing protein, partial [Streptomyces sp. NPDC048551]|uniref:alpha/beta hydrolase fold domain-containing protein n=1 Tax=Streptomyces sp. NPDC048551 TaxID=3155758 RepID=UPI00342C5AD5
MTLRRVLSGLGAAATLGAAAAISTRRRALAAVPRELRHPVLFLPLNLGNPVTLAIARRVVPLAGAALRPGVRIERRTLPATTDDLPVEVLTYRASGQAPRAALLWIHGGGTVMGAARQENTWCSRVADELGALVVSVDYRLAPENPYPAALDDCFGALRWLHASAADLGIDPARIAVGGESAGGAWLDSVGSLYTVMVGQ